MGFHLHQDMYVFLYIAVPAILGRSEEARGALAAHHRGIVRIGGEHPARMRRVGVLDQFEQAFRHGIAVNGPAGIEDLVAAMLRVHLGERHQFHVRGIALQPGERLMKVINLTRGQSQSHFRIGFQQRRPAAGADRDMRQPSGFPHSEQRSGLVNVADD